MAQLYYRYSTMNAGKSIELIKGGSAIAIFPQGHRYPGVNPADTPIRNGAGLIAYRTGAPIVPVCIKTEGVKYKLFKKVQVIFGKPISNEELGFTKGGSDEYARATEIAYERLLRLGGYEKTNETKDEGK